MSICMKRYFLPLYLIAIINPAMAQDDTMHERNFNYALLFGVPDSETTEIAFRKYLPDRGAWEYTASFVATSNRTGTVASDSAVVELSVSKLSYFNIGRVSTYYLVGAGVGFGLGDNRDGSDVAILGGGVGVEYYPTPEFSIGGESIAAMRVTEDVIGVTTLTTQLKLGFHF